MGFFNKSAGVTTGQNTPTGLRVQRSLYGATIPVWYGRTKGSPLVVAAWNFTKQVAPVAGKKGGKASKKTGPTYVYYEDVDFLLSYGPMEGVSGAAFEQTYYWEFDIDVGGGSAPATTTINGNPAYFNMVIAVLQDVSYSVTVTDFGGLPVTLSGTTQQPLHNNAFPAPNGGSWSASGEPYATFNTTPGSTSVSVSGATGTIHVIAAYNINLYSPDIGPCTTVLSALGASFNQRFGITGAAASPPSPQAQLDDFSGLCILPASLGSGATLHNYNLTCKGLYGLNQYGDCNPADVIADIICSGNRPGGTVWNHGLGLSSRSQTGFSRWGGVLQDEPFVGSNGAGLNAVRNYCQANGIYVSMVMDAQQSAAQYIDDLLSIANSAAVYDGFQLWLIPYSEVSAAGGGKVYLAPSGVQATVFDDDYVTQPGESPITVKHSRPQDNWNSIQIDYTQRYSTAPPPWNARNSAPTYIDGTLTLSDQGDIWQQGQLPAHSVTLKWIHDPNVAATVGWTMLRRHLSCERSSYSFKLKPYYCMLVPMDIVMVNSAYLPFSPFPVRITKLTENADYSLDIEAEPYIFGSGSANIPPVTIPPPGGIVPVTPTVSPGCMNTPIIFETVSNMTSQPEIWLLASATDPNYGGCGVWLSTDGGNNYSRLGTMVGQSMMGVTTTSTYPAAADPDATDTLHVDLTESFGSLSTFSAGQQNMNESLCILGNGGTVNIGGNPVVIPYELVAYQAATLTSPNHYDLPGPIRRNVYGTPNVAHPAGTPFGFLGGGAVFTLPENPQWAGTTLYFKLTAFNIFAQNELPLSDPCTGPFPFTPTGVVGSPTLSYVVGANLNCLVASLQVVARHDFDVPTTIADNLVPSQAYVQVPPSSTQVFSIQKFTSANWAVGTQFGTVTFGPGSNVGTFTGTATSFAIGEVLAIVGPTVPGDGAGMAFTIVGVKQFAPTVTGFAVTPSPATVAHGNTLQFSVTATLSNNTTGAVTTPVAWSASNGHATINATTGVATGVSAGSVTITASQGSVTATSTLTVT